MIPIPLFDYDICVVCFCALHVGTCTAMVTEPIEDATQERGWRESEPHPCGCTEPVSEAERGARPVILSGDAS